jgi:hypothetical protein
VALPEHVEDLRRGDAALGEEHERVIQEIGGLLGDSWPRP